MAGKRKGINLKIYKLLKQSPAMPRAVVLSKLGLGEEHTVSVYRIRMEVQKEIRKQLGRLKQPISETMQRQRELEIRFKEAAEEAAAREREKTAKKLRHAIEVGNAEEVRSYIDVLIAELSNSDGSKDVLKKVFALFQEDLVHMRQAYDMLSRHHDTCLLQIADLQRQTDVAFGWKYLWKWLMYHIRPRKNTGW